MAVMPMAESLSFDVAGNRGIQLERGFGARVWDQRNRALLDFMAGHGVMNLGHGRPEITEAVLRQLGQLAHCSMAFDQHQRQRLMERLVKITGLRDYRVFLSNSGTESVEAALKFARIHTGRSKIVGCIRGFHGRSYGSLSAGFNPRHRRNCGSLLPDCEHIPFGDVGALARVVDDQTAAVILELVQGEGGVRIAPNDFVTQAVALCREKGAVLIVDEVQTGFGRCGSPFAIQRYGIQPDILCLAKALGGGLPIGATLFHPQIQPVKGMHGSTFGGSPVSCAAANAFLDLFEREFHDLEVEEKGAHLAQSLRTMSQVSAVRQIGLMVAADLGSQARLALEYLQNDGLLALSAGPQTLRFLPPLTISWGELNQGIDILRKTLN